MYQLGLFVDIVRNIIFQNVPLEIECKDYVCVSTGVIDKNKEHYLRCKDKAKKSMTNNKTYKITYVKIPIKWWRITIRYVKPTAQLLLKIWFPKKWTNIQEASD